MISDLYILLDDDPRLRLKSTTVYTWTDDLTEIVEHMKLLLVKENGIGLSAPQVGINKRFFIMKVKNEIRCFINPIIISTGRLVPKLEGCLSVKNRLFMKERHDRIVASYHDMSSFTNRNEEVLTFAYTEVINSFKGVEAQCFQHELEHLDGILLYDSIIKEV